MIDIPKNATRIEDFEAEVDKVCEGIVDVINCQLALNYACVSALVQTEHCYSGGHPMAVIREVAKRFASKGWFCYLVRGGNYSNWTWLEVRNAEHQEGFTEANVPSYYKRVK